MANALATSAKALWLTTGRNVTTATVKFVALTSAYTFSAAHDNLDDVGAGARIATSATITNFTVTGNVVDCDDFTIPATAAGTACVAGWFYHSSGVESTSTLLYFYNPGGTLFTTNGELVNVVVDAGANKLFAL
jgi:hypothetical protein